MSKINSATRLLLLLQSANQHGKGRATYQVLAQLFGVPADQNIKTHFAVVEHALWVQAEIDAILNGMAENKIIPNNLYAPQLSRVSNALGPLNMASDFEGVRNILTAEVLNAVETCGALLPDEENEISPDDLASLRNLTTELEALLEGSALPPYIRELIRRHITMIHRTLDRYGVSGARAFREAAYSALGELTAVGESLKPYADSPEIGKLRELWDKAGTIADMAIKADALLQLGQKITEAIGKLPI